jgi:hypothetical protein
MTAAKIPFCLRRLRAELGGLVRMKSLMVYCLATMLTACASSEVITDYATTYKLLDIRGSVINRKTGSRVAALAVYESTNVLAPVGSQRGLIVSRNDDIEIYVVVGLAQLAIGSPNVKVIVDDQRSNEVLVTRLFSDVELEGEKQRKTLVIKAPRAACRSLRISVLGSPSELVTERVGRNIRMLNLCSRN